MTCRTLHCFVVVDLFLDKIFAIWWLVVVLLFIRNVLVFVPCLPLLAIVGVERVVGFTLLSGDDVFCELCLPCNSKCIVFALALLNWGRVSTFYLSSVDFFL